MEKERRQQQILHLIGARRIGTQQELAEHLARSGMAATQSSISRDMEELGIVKQGGRYVLPRLSRGVNGAQGLLGLEPAGECLVVAKCEPGLASAVAVRIDRATIDEIVGTIAGEDTVFIAVAGSRTQRAAMKKIWALFN